MGKTKVRKQIYDVTPADLKRYPVWEYASDEESAKGHDECTARPVVSPLPVDPTKDYVMVSAKFELRNGTILPGLVSVSPGGSNDLGSTLPSIVTDGGHVNFWCGVIGPSKADLKAAYKLLGFGPRSVFPIQFETSYPLKGGSIVGEIDGFYQLLDWESGRTKIHK